MHKSKRPRTGNRTLNIPVCLTKEEHAALKAICTEERITYSRLLEAFICDATKSRRSVGVDFYWWFEVRRCNPLWLSCRGRDETLATTPESEIFRRLKWLQSWQHKATTERAREECGQREHLAYPSAWTEGIGIGPASTKKSPTTPSQVQQWG